MAHGEKCPVCEGVGKIKKKKCHGCDGAGWVTIGGEYPVIPTIPVSPQKLPQFPGPIEPYCFNNPFSELYRDENWPGASVGVPNPNGEYIKSFFEMNGQAFDDAVLNLSKNTK